MVAVLVGCFTLLTSSAIVLLNQPPARAPRAVATRKASTPALASTPHTALRSATRAHRRGRTTAQTPTNEPAQTRPRAMPVAKLAGQVIMSGMNGTRPDAQLLNDVS
jgi:hypothetical protein